MINPVYPALENRKIAFDSIGMDIATHIFANAVVHHAVLLEASPQAFGGRAFIGHNEGRGIDLRFDNGAKRLGRDGGDMVRLYPTAALDQCEDGFLAGAASTEMLALAGVLVLLQAADKSFIDLDHLALCAQPRKLAIAHCLP